MKRYACHVTAQAPIQFLRQVMSETGFGADDIADVELGVSEKVRSHHAAKRPHDTVGAQYSVPFAFATAAFHDPDDPMTFARDNVGDPSVIELTERTPLGLHDVQDSCPCDYLGATSGPFSRRSGLPDLTHNRHGQSS